MSDEKFEQWAIIELLGHVKMAGMVTEEKRFGTEMGRVDIPGENDTFTTQYFSGSSVYRITPTTEEIARACALKWQTPAPVHQWELRALEGPRSRSVQSEDFDNSDPYEEDADIRVNDGPRSEDYMNPDFDADSDDLDAWGGGEDFEAEREEAP